MKRKYRVVYGSHWIPNPEFQLSDKGMPVDESPSHVEAVQGDVIELDEERAEQFTKVFFGQPAKLALVSDSAGVPEIKTGGPPSPPTTPPPIVPQSPAVVQVKESPKHSGAVGAKG
jgi:hypothetical protein